jgi:hypothetical protein
MIHRAVYAAKAGARAGGPGWHEDPNGVTDETGRGGVEVKVRRASRTQRAWAHVAGAGVATWGACHALAIRAERVAGQAAILYVWQACG